MQRTLLSVLVVSLFAAPVMAQITEPITFTVLTKQQRNAATYTTASVEIPEGVGSVSVVGQMSDAEKSDPANFARVAVYVSQSGTFAVGDNHLIFSTSWTGGLIPDKQNPGQFIPRPFEFGFGPMQAYAGWRIRGELDIPQRLNLGLDVRANPPAQAP